MYVGRTENFSPFEADEKRLNSDKVLPSRTSKVNLLVLLKRYLSQHLYFLSLGKEKNYSLLESPILFDTVNLSLHEQNLQDTGTCSDGRCHIPDCFCKSLTRTREFSFWPTHSFEENVQKEIYSWRNLSWIGAAKLSLNGVRPEEPLLRLVTLLDEEQHLSWQVVWRCFAATDQRNCEGLNFLEQHRKNFPIASFMRGIQCRRLSPVHTSYWSDYPSATPTHRSYSQAPNIIFNKGRSRIEDGPSAVGRLTSKINKSERW